MRTSLLLILIGVFCSPVGATEILACKSDLVNDVSIKIETIADIRANLHQLKVGHGGVIEFGPDGFPDAISYAIIIAGHDIANNRWKPMPASGPDRKLLLELDFYYYATQKLIWDNPHNAKLELTYRSGGNFRAGRDLSLTELMYIRGGRNFRNTDWWTHDGVNVSNGYEDFNITIENSRSSVLSSTGAVASRIHWPFTRDSHIYFNPMPDMFGPHFRDNFGSHPELGRDKNEKSVELFAPEFITKTTGPFWNRKTETKIVWREYLFQEVAERWIPRVNHLSKVRATDCARCHSVLDAKGNPLLDEEGKIILSPRPNLLKNRDDFRAVGYKDEKVIEAFIKAFPRPTD